MNKNTSNDIFFREGNVISDDYMSDTIIPVGTKVECYINMDGVDSKSGHGFSEYYVVDKKLTMNEFILLIENNHVSSIENKTMELIIDSSMDNENYTAVSSII